MLAADISGKLAGAAAGLCVLDYAPTSCVLVRLQIGAARVLLSGTSRSWSWSVRYLNAIVLGGLILCGAAIFLGLLLNNGHLQWLGTYTGWFLAAYSIAAYLVASILYALRGSVSFWPNLYAVNFALSLLGIAAFGISSATEAVAPAIAALAAGIVGLLVARRYNTGIRLIPIAMILVIAGPLLESIATIWVYIFVGAAGALIGLTLAFARTSKQDAGATA